ncbi:hypothetical protein ACH5RR_009128 [Cinchona calisaya]|uniref:K Homology domain-containing protein n=1 Tax=Cinchona calisaya TaxID=153742 RepID=A0ABD3ADE7_9GENT
MDRSRSSKRYYYDHQDYDSEFNPSRNKPRYNNSHSGSYHYPHQHRRGAAVGGGGGGGAGRKMQDPSLTVTTSYRILCHDVKAGGVIGKSGSIIKAIRQHTGAWINVHELIPGDEERIIEISDTRRRDPEGRIPAFSPAQEALFLIHERILESDVGGGSIEDGYGYGNREKAVVTRLVVSRMHVGSLLGKGGKIIEQMRIETKTHIRILPRDHTLPRCVAKSEEIVQVVGDVNAVKNAIAVISSRLRESQHRDRSQIQGRLHSPERFFPDEDFIAHNNLVRQTSADGSNFGSRFPAGLTGGRGNTYLSRQSGHALESEATPMTDNAQFFSGEDLIFRILCPVEKVNCIVGEPDGIMDLLQNEVGVDVKVIDRVAGSDEQIIIVTSDEGPDDELFPAQEALLHIQTHIVDLVPEKENIVTTRLILQSEEIACFNGRDGSLSELGKIAGADVQILPREELPVCVSENDEIVQIVGEIKAAREALLELTSKLRSYFYSELFKNNMPIPSESASSLMEGALVHEGTSGNNMVPTQEDHLAKDPLISAHQNVPNTAAAQPINTATAQPMKDTTSGDEARKQNESEHPEDVPTGLNRISVPLVTRSTLEVVIPPNAASKLITKSRNKLAQISELSGANVQLVEDRPESTQKIIQISGTPEQAERAQSLLEGFILSIEEDGP